MDGSNPMGADQVSNLSTGRVKKAKRVTPTKNATQFMKTEAAKKASSPAEVIAKEQERQSNRVAKAKSDNILAVNRRIGSTDTDEINRAAVEAAARRQANARGEHEVQTQGFSSGKDAENFEQWQANKRDANARVAASSHATRINVGSLTVRDEKGDPRPLIRPAEENPILTGPQWTPKYKEQVGKVTQFNAGLAKQKALQNQTGGADEIYNPRQPPAAPLSSSETNVARSNAVKQTVRRAQSRLSGGVTSLNGTTP